jgi:F0F1-type ATP synthase membrane subunit b/b'
MEKMLPTIAHIWQVFVSSNLFNFTVFLIIFAIIFKKIDIKNMLASMQQKVIDLIEAAKTSREAAYSQLKAAEKSVENLDSELKVIIEDASKSAEMIGEKLLAEAKKQAQNIESNALKVINAEEKMLTSKLTHNASKASVEIAKKHISKSLDLNPALHEKYINESIDSLDRLNF